MVAGTGMDVRSGMCGSRECRTRVVDDEFGQLLHYFDYFVMEGPQATVYKSLFDKAKNKNWLENLLIWLDTDVPFLLHLRSIGLDKYVIFFPTNQHWARTSFVNDLPHPDSATCGTREN